MAKDAVKNSSQEKIIKPPEKTDVTPEKIPTPVTKKEDQNWQKFAILGVIGAVATVLLGIVVQAGYNKFIIQPRLERTFPFAKQFQFSDILRPVFHNGSILKIVNVRDGATFLNLQIEAGENQTEVLLTNLDWYQNQEGDHNSFGKLQYQYNHLIVTIRFIIENNAVNLIYDANGYDHLRQNASHSIIVSQGDNFHQFTIPLVDDVQDDLVFPTEDFTPSGEYDNIKKSYEEKAEKFRIEFENVYGLQKKNLPTFYQEMGRFALSAALNSYNFMNSTNFIGKQNGKFSTNSRYWGIKANGEEALDSQVFQLIITSEFDVEGVQNALLSWINTLNELKEIGTKYSEHSVQLGEIQQLTLFNVLKSISKNPAYSDFLKSIYPQLEIISLETQKHQTKWLGTSSGLFNTIQNSNDTDSFELTCLLVQLNQVMAEIAKIAGKNHENYDANVVFLKNTFLNFWNTESEQFGDLKNKKWVPSENSEFAALILGVLGADSEILSKNVLALENHPMWTKMGLKLSTEEGAPISTNFLLLGSLKKYSELSGPSQHKAHVLYSILKNNLIAYIARSFKSTRSFHNYYNGEGVGIGPGLSNNGALILPIMAEIFN